MPKNPTEKLAYAMCEADGIHPETNIPGGKGAEYMWEIYLEDALRWIKNRESFDKLDRIDN